MKTKLHIIISTLFLLFLAGCASKRQLSFSGKDWFLSNHYAEIIDTDSLYRFTLNKELVDSETPLIGKSDSEYLTPAMIEYLKEILKLSRVENGEIMFFAPKYGVLFVTLDKNEPPIRPLSLSCQLNDSLPYTFWVRPWEEEKWKRQEDQMYTNIYKDQGKKRIIVVDRFMYGDIPIARITIIQSVTNKLKKKFPNNEIGMSWMDINKPESLDAVSYWINGHREASFENFKLGRRKN
ncbi:MAG: hypothetical protein J1F16_00070 [Muribaculaceae bacterium]|nr:hypothetical protein [Muribaculaceae bacterium]